MVKTSCKIIWRPQLTNGLPLNSSIRVNLVSQSQTEQCPKQSYPKTTTPPTNAHQAFLIQSLILKLGPSLPSPLLADLRDKSSLDPSQVIGETMLLGLEQSLE